MVKKKKRKSVIGGEAKLLNIPRNWLSQGILYMDTTELLFRIGSEFLGLCLFVLLSSFLLQIDIFHWKTILFSILIVHTIYWIVFSNWWALMLFAFPGLRNAGENATCYYLSKMAARLETRQAIKALLVYGSVTRGEWHDKSDIDVRILRKEGLVNGFQAFVIVMKERYRAFLGGQPLDLFLADEINFLNKMRSDEKPFVLVLQASLQDQKKLGEVIILGDSWPER